MSGIGNFFVTIGEKTNPIIFIVRLILSLMMFVAGVMLMYPNDDDKESRRVGIVALITSIGSLIGAVIWYYAVKQSRVVAGVSGGLLSYDVARTLL